MYSQPLFSIHEHGELRKLIRRYPLATLMTTTTTGPDANLLPLEFVDESLHGVLRGHVARTHSLWTQALEGDTTMAVFQSPNAYVSPRWYVNGQRSGRLAPSWNYVAVQARGRLRFIEDGAWLMKHLGALTNSQESTREHPWSLADASAEFVADASKRLIGFEIQIQDLTGKRFLSQQRTEADRRSLIDHLHLERSGSAKDLADLIAT